MSVTVRGRVPNEWSPQTALHITERLRALEKAMAGGVEIFRSPAAPPTGPTIIVTPGSGGTGGPGTGGVTDHGDLTGLLDNDHPQYAQRGERPPIHGHSSFDVSGLEGRFHLRGEAARPAQHRHNAQDISGLDQSPPMLRKHVHSQGDISDLSASDTQFILASQIFGW